jgi:hypothetical protein
VYLALDAIPRRGMTLDRVFTPGLQFDNAEKRVLRLVSIYPHSSVSCAAVKLRTRFTTFADRVAHSRPPAKTRPIVVLVLRTPCSPMSQSIRFLKLSVSGGGATCLAPLCVLAVSGFRSPALLRSA